jgi:hypothetical protein
LRIKTLLIPASHYYINSEETAFVSDFLVPLNCQWEGDLKPLSVHVRRVYRDQFIRVRPELLTALDLVDDTNTQRGRHEDIVYVKQQEGIGQTLKHVFSIDFSSALNHEYPDAEKWPDSDEYWQPGTDKGGVFLVLEKASRPARGVLYFRKLNPRHQADDRFAVVLSISLNCPGVDIMCQLKDTLNSDLQWVKARRGQRRSGLDKLSIKLQSGASVSVKLRKNGKLGGIQKYLVDVKIDPEGSLPWPDPEPDLTSITVVCQMESRV